jgi:hypothetical protein
MYIVHVCLEKVILIWCNILFNSIIKNVLLGITSTDYVRMKKYGESFEFKCVNCSSNTVLYFLHEISFYFIHIYNKHFCSQPGDSHTRNSSSQPSSSGHMHTRNYSSKPSSSGHMHTRNSSSKPSSSGHIQTRDSASQPSTSSHIRDSASEPSTSGLITTRISASQTSSSGHITTKITALQPSLAMVFHTQ